MRKAGGLVAIAFILAAPRLMAQCAERVPRLIPRSQQHQEAQRGGAKKVEVIVTMLAARSGKPLKDRDVQIFGTNSCYVLLKENTVFHFQAKTGTDGVVHFQVPTPFPSRFLFYSAQADLCIANGSVAPKGLEQTGIVVPNTCVGKHSKYNWSKVRARPGEIVIFAIEPRGAW